MASTLFKTKSIDQLKAEAGGSEGGMKRTLNAFNLTTLGIGAIIGAGIFSLVGTASQAAGLDLGPEGGAAGGELLYAGAPEGLLEVEGSYTAQYLAPKLRPALPVV